MSSHDGVGSQQLAGCSPLSGCLGALGEDRRRPSSSSQDMRKIIHITFEHASSFSPPPAAARSIPRHRGKVIRNAPLVRRQALVHPHRQVAAASLWVVHVRLVRLFTRPRLFKRKLLVRQRDEFGVHRAEFARERLPIAHLALKPRANPGVGGRNGKLVSRLVGSVRRAVLLLRRSGAGRARDDGRASARSRGCRDASSRRHRRRRQHDSVHHLFPHRARGAPTSEREHRTPLPAD
jgi:hypothetical protein